MRQEKEMNTTPHNPDHLTPEQVGVAQGWRLLDEDEVVTSMRIQVFVCEYWTALKYWTAHGPGYHKDKTYRTPLTRTELRSARGLPPEVTPQSIAAIRADLHAQIQRDCGKQADGGAGTLITLYNGKWFDGVGCEIELKAGDRLIRRSPDDNSFELIRSQ